MRFVKGGVARALWNPCARPPPGAHGVEVIASTTAPTRCRVGGEDGGEVGRPETVAAGPGAVAGGALVTAEKTPAVPAGARVAGEAGSGGRSRARSRRLRSGSERIHLPITQALEPTVPGRGDPNLEALDAGLELAVRRDPEDERVGRWPSRVSPMTTTSSPLVITADTYSKSGRTRRPPPNACRDRRFRTRGAASRAALREPLRHDLQRESRPLRDQAPTKSFSLSKASACLSNSRRRPRT